jgi:hypothetical protein
MSRENVETAKMIYPGPLDLTAIFASSEALDAARAQLEPLFEPNFETVHDPTAVGLAVGDPTGTGVIEGVEGFIGMWREWLSVWESWVVTPTGFIDVDHQRILVLLTFEGRSQTHGAGMTLDGGNLLSFRKGKVERLELFFKRGDALQAAGLSE